MNADRAIRAAAAAAVVFVAGVAAVISYQHAYALVVAHGETGATARALPLTVDGLIATCSLVLLDSARRRQPGPRLAWFLLGVGVVATLGANVSHGLAHGPVGAVIAGWPALVAVGSFEMLARLIRGGREQPANLFDNVQEVDSATGQDRSRPPFTSAPPRTGNPNEIAKPLGDLPASRSASGVPVSPGLEPLRERARERFSADLAAGRVPSVRAIRQQLHIGHPRAKEVHRYLTETSQ